MQNDNPVSRLHNILTNAAKHDGQQQTIRVWWDVLGLGKYSSSEEDKILDRFQQLSGLYDDAVEAMAEVPGLNEELYLPWVRSLQNLFRIKNLFTSWEIQKKNLDTLTMQSLAFSADRLKQTNLVDHIKKSELERLMQEATALHESIITADLEQDVKELLLRMTREIMRALDEYYIRGPKRLIRAAETVAGTLIVNYEKFNPSRNSKHLERLKKLWKVIVDLSTISGAMTELGPGASEFAQKFLK